MMSFGHRLIGVCYEQVSFAAFDLTAILGLVCEIDHRLLRSLSRASPDRTHHVTSIATNYVRVFVTQVPDHSCSSEISHRPACGVVLRVSRLSRCRNAILSVMPQQPVYERHERCGRKTTKPQAEARKCPAKFADGENLRGTDAVCSDTGCDPACAPAFDPDEI
jgi:hypothetical protein